MAALYYAMIKRDPQAYEKLAKELFRTGEYAIGSYVIGPHEKALNMYETKPTDSDYISMGMYEIDWIVLATTRSKESLNSQFVYNGFENGNIDMLKAVNWPDLLTRMCKEVAGFTNAKAHGLSFNSINNKKRIISARIHDYFSNSDLEELLEIDRLYKLGKTILLMIDAEMIDDKSNYNSFVSIGNNSHWIVYEGGLQFLDINKQTTIYLDNVKHIKFKIYTWGENPLKSRFITKPLVDGLSVKSFKSNYYGYIEAQ
ncbi:hypothetical protein Q9Q97_18080 [Flavobacterium sp. DG2-3]|nr:hypothetical protein [Flavobacterium sp. DG2-3]